MSIVISYHSIKCHKFMKTNTALKYTRIWIMNHLAFLILWIMNHLADHTRGHFLNYEACGGSIRKVMSKMSAYHQGAPEVSCLQSRCYKHELATWHSPYHSNSIHALRCTDVHAPLGNNYSCMFQNVFLDSSFHTSSWMTVSFMSQGFHSSFILIRQSNYY